MELKRKLTLFDLTMIAIGSTIGSGIFFTPSLIANALQSPILILFAWILGGLAALTGALTLSELSCLFPKAGGIYVYLKEAFGNLTGFLFGWAYFWVVNSGGIAALSVAFSTYFCYLIHASPDMIKVIAIIGIAVVTLINVLGVKAGGIFSDVFTLLKLFGISGLIIVGLFLGSAHTTDFTIGLIPGKSYSNMFALAMVGVLWSIGGWQHATFTSSEAINPQKNLPRAMIIAVIAVIIIYLLANIAYMFLLTPVQIGSSKTLAADAVNIVFGSVGSTLIALAIFISTFGTTGIYTLTAPRIYYAMANDRLFFTSLAKISKRFNTPANAIIIQSIWAVILILLWGTFENLISYVVFVDWIFFGLAGISIFIFRRILPDVQRTYRTHLYPVTPLFFSAVSFWFVLNTLINKPEQAVLGIVFLGLGIPAYFYWKKKLL